MKVLNINNEAVKLTDQEFKVYQSLKETEVLDDCFCCHPEDLRDETNIPMKQLRGLISSLVKKELAYVDELISGCGYWVILFENK